MLASVHIPQHGSKVYQSLSTAFRPHSAGKEEVDSTNPFFATADDIKKLSTLSPPLLDHIVEAALGSGHSALPA